MAKFGGPGTLKQPCARRVCEHLRAGKPAEGGGKRDGGGFALCALPAGLKATLPAHDVARLGRALLASVSARPEGRVLEAASSPPEGDASRGGASLGEIRARLDGGGYGEDVSAFAADVRALYVRLHAGLAEGRGPAGGGGGAEGRAGGGAGRGAAGGGGSPLAHAGLLAFEESLASDLAACVRRSAAGEQGPAAKRARHRGPRREEEEEEEGSERGHRR